MNVSGESPVPRGSEQRLQASVDKQQDCHERQKRCAVWAVKAKNAEQRALGLQGTLKS
jgi:hypothetical protein